MPPIFEYLLKLSLSLIAICVFYQLVLRRLTFYNWNRWYLLGYSILSFGMALIDITPLLQQHALTQNRVLTYIPSMQNLTAQIAGPAEVTGASAWTLGTKWDWMLILLLTGICLLIVRFILSLLSIRRIRRRATLVSEGDMQLYLIDQPIAPFSFGNGIYINKQLHSESELQDIIRHEFVHVRQQHTIDIIMGELLCILNWYNPCAWLLGRAIRQNLEFIADRQVIQSGIDRKQYQYLLLKVMGNKNFSIANNFNFSSLKKRIAMMNKMRSARRHLIRFFFLLPLLTVLLLAFRSRLIAGEKEGSLLVAGLTIDAVTNRPLPGVTVTHEPGGQKVVSDQKGYYSFYIPAKQTLNEVQISFSLNGWNFTKPSRLSEKGETPCNLVVLGYLHPADRPERMHASYEVRVEGAPDYEMVTRLWSSMQISHKKGERLRTVMEQSTVPVAVVEGTPCVISADGAMAWLSGEDRLISSAFRVKVGDRIMTMEEANKTIALKDVKTVGAAERRYALQKYGYDGGLLLLNTTVADQKIREASDTIVLPARQNWDPQPTESQKDFIRRHPAVERISWGYMSDVKIADGDDMETKKLRSGFKTGDMFMIIHFKNGKWDMYNVNNEESVGKFKKNYGETPPKAPAPPATSLTEKAAKPAESTLPSTATNAQTTVLPSSVSLAGNPAGEARHSKRPGAFSYLAADSLIWSADKNTLTLMGNAVAMDEEKETILKSDAIILRQSKPVEKVLLDGKSLVADDLQVNPQRFSMRMQTLTAAEASRRYGTDFTGTVLEITTEKVEGKR